VAPGLSGGKGGKMHALKLDSIAAVTEDSGEIIGNIVFYQSFLTFF